MLPLRTIRLTSLFTHHHYGVRVLCSRRLSQSSVRYARQRNFKSSETGPPSNSISQATLDEQMDDFGDDSDNVNLFEQDMLGPKERRVPIGDHSNELAEIRKMKEELDSDSGGIESLLEDSEKTDEEDAELFRGYLTDEQYGRIQEQVEKLPDVLPLETSPTQVKVEGRLSDAGKTALKSLNESLDDASSTNPGIAKQALWRCYERSKLHVPNVLNVIPDKAWEVLWNTFSRYTKDNPNRASHIGVICKDMISAGHALSQTQRFAWIESLFLDDKQEQALNLWEAGLRSGDAGNPDYLELGIKMYSQTGNTLRAEELLDALTKLYDKWKAAITIPVLVSHVNHAKKEGFDKAFGLYLCLRDRADPELSLEDYDQISGAFLSAGQKDYALAVFRDMMMKGDLKSSDLPHRSVSDRMDAFMTSTKDPVELNTFGLDSLTFLPRKFQNKFFYASWMKRLIGMGQIDDAAQIVELMYERGVTPDAKHVNGVLGGWLRTSARSSHERAERTAWAMIQARLDFVNQRKTNSLPEANGAKRTVHENSEMAHVPLFDNRPVPPATIETFCILVQWYLRRGMFENVRHLRNMLVHAEMSMNSYFMNHLLYAERRNRTHREVWHRFEILTRTVTPDLETFSCLWECMKLHVDPARNADPSGFPSPRQLFAKMQTWYRGLAGQNLRDARDDVEADLYNSIVHSFCLAKDLEGTFAAIHGLKELWGLRVEPASVEMLMKQIARLNAPAPLNLWKPSHRKSRQYTASRENRQQIMLAVQALDKITKSRRLGMKEHGVNFEELDPMQQAEENHKAVLQLLFTVMTEVHGDTLTTNKAIMAAAAELGVKHFDTERVMALELES